MLQRYVSGDGTVPYESLRYPAMWIDDDTDTDIITVEMPGLEHRSMLAEDAFIGYVIRALCEKTDHQQEKQRSRISILRPSSTVGSKGAMSPRS